MPVVASFDGAARRIYLDVSTVNAVWDPVDIYREYRALRRTDEAFRVWDPFMEYVGNQPKGNGKATPRYMLLKDGVKIIPFDAAGFTEADGEILTDDQTDPFDVTMMTNSVVVKYSPADAEIVYVEIPSPIQDRLDYNNKVLVDPSTAFTGTEYPIGTSAQPVNNMADAVAIAATYDLNTFEVRGQVTITQDVSGKSFTSVAKTGEVTVSVVANVNECRFDHIGLEGDFNGANIDAERCRLGDCDNIQGDLYHCGLGGTLLIAAYGALQIDGCTSRIPGFESPVIDMNPGIDTQVNGRAMSSGVKVTNCDTPLSTATFEFVAGRINIDPTCTDGTISIRDSLDIQNSTGGTVVDASPTVNNAVWGNYPAQLSQLQNPNAQEIAELVVERLLGTTTFNG